MTTRSLRTAALAILVVAPLAGAQDGGIRFSVSRAVSGNNSDNSGFNISGSQVAGNTFGPNNVNAGSGNRTLITGAGTSRAFVPGGTITVSGAAMSNAAVVSAFATVQSQLASGSMTLATADSGSVTITFAPSLGRVMASTIDPRSVASAEAADAARFRTAVALELEANGLDRGSAVGTADALLEVARMQAAQSDVAPGAAGRAVAHASSAVARMSAALAAFMLAEPRAPVPAPMLAAGVVVRAAAATALPLPARMTK